MFAGKKVIAVLPAAGSGSRMKLRQSKLLCKVAGQEIILKSVLAFSSCGFTDQIIIPCRESEAAVFSEVFSLIKSPPLKLVAGGAQRQDSVRNALDYLAQNLDSPDNILVIIHDAARCFVSFDLIERCLLAALQYKAVTAAVDCVDTVYMADDKGVLTLPLLERKTLRAIQTPQVFEYNLLRQAHHQCVGSSNTDDAGMVAQIAPVYCVQGEPKNIKITIPEDLQNQKQRG